MKLSSEEKKELEVLCQKHPIVKRLFEELRGYEGSDPTKKLFVSISNAITTMADDVNTIIGLDEDEGRDTIIIGSDKDDKTFERIDKAIVNSAKYFEAIMKGKAAIDPELIPKAPSTTDKISFKQHNSSPTQTRSKGKESNKHLKN